MTLAYRGVSVLVLAPLCALLAVLFSADAPLFASYTQVFMTALGGFVIAFFPLFLLGAVFGKLMEASVAARAIAQGIVRRLGTQHAVLAIVLACAVLTYGGVSLFVVAFAVYPIAAALFRQAQVPKRLIPATIALGAFTFTMTALPGTPAIQNAIPMPFFGTTPFAEPGLGVIGGAVMLGVGWWWIVRRAKSAQRAGEGYGVDAATFDAANRSVTLPEAPAMPAPVAVATPESMTMPFGMAIAPVALVIALNYLLSTWLWPALDTSYLAGVRYGGTTVQAVRGIWAVIGALSAAIVLLAWLWWLARRRAAADRFPLKSVLEQAAGASVMPLMNTASQVGVRRGDRVTGRFRADPRRSAGHRPGQPAGVDVDRDQHPGWHHRLGIWRHEHRAADPGRDVAGDGPRGRHRPGTAAPRDRDRHRRPRCAAAQRCGDHAAGHLRALAPQELPRIFVVAVAVPLLALVTELALGTAFGSFRAPEFACGLQRRRRCRFHSTDSFHAAETRK